MLYFIFGSTRRDRSKTVLLILLTVLSGIVGLWTFRGETAVQLYGDCAYYAYWVLALSWLIAFGLVIRERGGVGELGAFIKERKLHLALVTSVGAWLAFGVQSGGVRIVNDDLLQVQTSQQLHLAREAVVSDRGYYVLGRFVDFGRHVDKRPALFSWVVAQVHTLKGYEFENAVIVNQVSLLALAVLLYLIGTRLHASYGGVLLSLLVLGVPLIIHHASGPGFEVFNLTLIALAWWASLVALEQRTYAACGLAALSGVLVANARYESVIFLLPVGICLLAVWRSVQRPLVNWAVLLSPVLMVPRLWLQHVFADERSWQLESKPEAQGAAFAARFFYDNVGHTLNFFLSSDTKDGNPFPLFVVGVIAVGFWLIVLYRRTISALKALDTNFGQYVFWGGLCLHLLLMLLYFWGQFDDLTTQRLAIPVMLWLAFPIVGVLGHLQVKRSFWLAAIGAALVYTTAFSAPFVARGDMLAMNPAAATHEKIRRWIKDHPNPTRAVICGYSMRLWLLAKNGIIPFRLVREGRENFEFHWKAESFSEVLVVQIYCYDPSSEQWLVEPDHDLGPDFKLEEMWRIPNTPSRQVRLSRLVSLSSDHPYWEPPPNRTVEEQRKVEKERMEYDLLWGKKLP